MAKLLEIKDIVLRLYSKFDTYVNMILKFIVALVMLLMIRSSIGYMAKVSSVPVCLIIALVCCLLPMSASLWIGALVILLDLYSLCLEAALVGLLLFAVIYFMYFRFCPKDNAIALLIPILSRIGIPHVMPIATGLLRPVYSALTVACGTICYYYIAGVHKSANILSNAASSESGDKLQVIMGTLTENKEMYVMLIAMALTTLVVYVLRRLRVDFAWIIATVAGAVLQFLLVVVLSLVMNVSPDYLLLILGTLLAIAAGFVIQFFMMNLDYARTERVQYEDDEYYYYVTAVPKRLVSKKEVSVKQFGNTGRIPIPKNIKEANPPKETPTGDTVIMDRKALAKELDIDEDLLN